MIGLVAADALGYRTTSSMLNEFHHGGHSTAEFFESDKIFEKMNSDMSLFRSYNKNFYLNACKQNNWEIGKFVIDYAFKNEMKFKEFYISYITDSRMLHYVLKNYSKMFENQEKCIHELLENSLYEGYNDVIDYILDNNLLQDFKIEYFMFRKLTDINSFRKIYIRFPDFLSEISDWFLSCSFEIAKELRLVGLLRKLNIRNFYSEDLNIQEFIKDCSGEMYLNDFLNNNYFGSDFELFINLYYLTNSNFVVEKSKFDNFVSKILKSKPELNFKIFELYKRYN